MPTVPDIHRRGTRAAQAVVTPPLTIGTLWFVTDEGVTERWTGTAWESYSASAGGGGAPSAHASSHQNSGADELSVAGLSGLLADGQTPLAHHATHEPGGADALSALDAAVLTTGTVAAARLPARIGAIGLVIDGGGSAITTGVKGFLSVPFAGTITGWTLLSTDSAATAGSLVVDVWKDVYANYPPTVADTITAAAKPTLSAANKNSSTTLTGWTTAIAAGDVLGFSVDSAATVTKVALSLTVQAS